MAMNPVRRCTKALIISLLCIQLAGCAGMQITRVVPIDEAKQTELEGLQTMPAATKTQMCAAFRQGGLNVQLLAHDSYTLMQSQTKGTDMYLSFTEADYESMMLGLLDEFCT